MIKLDILCGLGNQLFEYAYARTLSLEYNEPIVINKMTVLTLLNKFKYPKMGSASYQLKYFNIVQCMFQNSLIGFIQSIFPFLHAYLHRKKTNDRKYLANLFLKMSAKGKYYFADSAMAGYFPHSTTKKKIKHVHGIWCSDKYFYKYSDIIKKELKVISPLSEQNKDLIGEMQNCSSVAVHFRRGDYVNIKDVALSYNICDEAYYKKSMHYIAERTENPIFYIFSDDIPWIQNNIKFEHTVKFIDNNNPGHEDLRLMYNCKHFITANSTFSWWGSYLSDNPEKIVISPNIYNMLYPDIKDIFRDDMILYDIRNQIFL